MDSYAQPCNTEHAYAQLYRPYNYLQVRFGYADPPCRKGQHFNTNIKLPELVSQTEFVPDTAPSTTEVLKRMRGRPRKKG
jgi:hypothetical protein